MITISRLVLFCLLLGISYTTLSQTKKEEAFLKGNQAVSLMDNGKPEESIKLLEDAQKLDPDNHAYPYELAYAYYIMNDFKKSSKYLEDLLDHKDVNDRIYQLLGNCYDHLGKREKSLQTYEIGLKKFPNSGNLYLEMGVMQLAVKDFEKALTYFEKGIQVAPQFPSNYYWAGKLYCNSSERVWGMIYGELFMNLERNSKRTVEMSKLLYDTYKAAIQFTSDSSMSVSFSKNNTINIESLSNPKDIKLPFGIGVYEPTILLSALGKESISLSSLNSIRSSFLDSYYSAGQDKDYPNVLFAYQRQVLLAGHLEAYNHWILMMGDEDAFAKWKSSNEFKWNTFIEWFGSNAIKITDSNKFHREQY